MIREKVVEGNVYELQAASTCRPFVASVALYSSVNQGVAVPISASGLIGLQPLRSMTHVGKGSRQIRSVPSEEGLALRNVLRVCVDFVPALDQASGITLRFSRPASRVVFV